MLRIRPLALAGKVRDAMRPGRGRTTTAVALGAAGSLIAGIVVAGMGAAGANPDLSDIGAWLTNDSKSSVSHVNGLTGQVDGRVKLPQGDNTQLQVAEDGKTILVLDETTGTVSRIDPAQLTVPQTADFGVGLQLKSGGGKAWLVDSANGTVQPIDPVSLAPVGAPLDAGGKPLGTAQADPNGTLWVPVPATGQLVPVNGDKIGSPLKVGEPGNPLLLTLASGRPVVADVRGGTVYVVSGTGIERSIKMPEEMLQGGPQKLIAAEVSEGPIVPILATDTGKLTLVNIDTGSITAVPLAVQAHEYAPPQVLGAKVYIPDRSTGHLLVYNTVQAQFEQELKVTGVPGPLEAYVRDGLLWVNDPNSATAAVVNVQGQIHLIGKYENTPGPGAGNATSSVTPTPGKSVPEGGVSTSPDAPSSSPVQSETPVTPTSSGTSTTAPPTDPGPPAPPDSPEPGDGGDDQLPGDDGPVVPPIDPPGNDNGGGNDNRPGPTKTPTPDPPTPTVTVTETKSPPQPPVTRPPVTPPPVTPPPVTPPPVTPPPVTPPSTPPTTKTQTPTPPKTTDPPKTSTPPATNTQPPATSTKPPSTSTKPPTSGMKPPGTPQAKSGAGKITLTFSPASGATPLRYKLGNVGAGLSVTPGSITPGQSYTFTVTGGVCEKEYSFFVIAEYPNGTANSKSSTAVRPCVIPGKPTALAAEEAGGGKATLTWKAPTKATGDKTTYTASWARGKSNGKTDTSDTDATFSVGGVAGSYTFKVVAKNSAGSNSTSTASLTKSLKWPTSKAASGSGTAPDPSSPSPSGPGDGSGAVANAAATVPNRRTGPVAIM